MRKSLVVGGVLAALTAGFGLLQAQGAASPQPEATPSAAATAPAVRPAFTETADVPANVKYFQLLLDTSNATYADGYRLAYVLERSVAGADAESRLRLTFQQYRELLIFSGIIDATWGSNPTELLTHQEAAYLFTKAMQLDGGILYSLTDTKRYAHREAIDQNLFPDINPRQYISGPELLSSFRTCKEYAVSRAR